MMTRKPGFQQPSVSLQRSSQPLRSLTTPQENSGGNEIWLTTLSDLLMLLMIFFVFLLAAPLLGASKSASPLPAPSPVMHPVISTNHPAAGSALEKPERIEQKAAPALEDDLQNLLNNRENPSAVTVERRSQFLVVTFPEQILFDSGQAQMKTAAGPTLEKVAAFIIEHPELSVEVQGHTDDRPIRSLRYPSNWELSADRAVGVAKALVEMGANPGQIATKGFGEYHPITPNVSDADRLKNRRVEIQFSVSQS